MKHAAAMQIKERTLADLEAVIQNGLKTFIDVGNALLEIRDRRLYRGQGFKTFEDYCEKRWGWKRAHAYRQIEAAQVVRNLSPIGDTPQTEGQIRPLVALPPHHQREAWNTAVIESGSSQPTAKQVDAVVKKNFLKVIAEKLAARRNPQQQKPAKSEKEKEEIRQLRETMKQNSARNSDVMTVIRAIEALSHPPVTMQDVADQITNLDTPDKDWRGQARAAQFNLSKLVKELP